MAKGFYKKYFYEHPWVQKVGVTDKSSANKELKEFLSTMEHDVDTEQIGVGMVLALLLITILIIGVVFVGLSFFYGCIIYFGLQAFTALGIIAVAPAFSSCVILGAVVEIILTILRAIRNV